jgi:hypothetical protein
MRYIDNDDIEGFVKAVLLRDLTQEEQALLEAALVRHHDPRRGYQVLNWATVQRMCGPYTRYSISNYVGGLGIGNGPEGCIGYLDDDAVRQYREENSRLFGGA